MPSINKIHLYKAQALTIELNSNKNIEYAIDEKIVSMIYTNCNILN